MAWLNIPFRVVMYFICVVLIAVSITLSPALWECTIERLAVENVSARNEQLRYLRLTFHNLWDTMMTMNKLSSFRDNHVNED
ncbi:putative transmembrane protein [Gregarina niphandrodes]|uniref:Transmembrane protein n=1 Tax=Gregarina niphandrodes TaxID=110365 RepID=A0A023BBW1_GRENI|nr:putative transmembrane protein [Gregarina niphandrodes]EZG81194.1 putative transmembrane protein [Gregarina niphandrodes]|eukprot:XP_011134252.1 putative transmembrane protein [Gregarina niphandrodes]